MAEFSNPIPVAVALLPVGDKLLGVRRNIEPRKGQIALPGGYIDSGETWQQAVTRELFEETNIQCSDSNVSLFSVVSAIDADRLLIFGLLPPMQESDIDFSVLNSETAEVVLIESNTELAFPIHSDIVRQYFQRCN